MICNYITGASGFIGSYLFKRLADEHTVAIPHADIGKIKLKPFQRFFFLSSYGNMAFHDDWDKIVKANVTDVLAIVSQMKRLSTGFGTFVFVSSSSVNLSIPTAYSRCKKATEEILLSIWHNWKPIIIVRPYSVTGVGEQKEHLIPRLIRSCVDGEEMPFCPNPVHDFVNVDDVADGLMEVSHRAPKGIYEFGTGKCYSNAEIKSLVEVATGRKAKISEMPPRTYDQADWYCNDQTARQHGWSPNRQLKDTISQMVNDYESSGKTHR